MEYLQLFDHTLFSAINSWNAPYFDRLMWLLAEKLVWIPMVLMLLWLSWRRGWQATLLIVAAIAVTIAISDQVASSLIKPLIERLRPSHDPSLADTIHLVNGYEGGLYGFVSSHAANAVGCATLIILLFRNRMTTVAMTLWALLVCYCRIYEGVHFPGDILGGAIVGVAAAFLVYLIYRRLLFRYLRKRTLFDHFDSKFMSLSVYFNILILCIIAVFPFF